MRALCYSIHGRKVGGSKHLLQNHIARVDSKKQAEKPNLLYKIAHSPKKQSTVTKSILVF